MQTIIIQNDYSVRPAQLWALATDYEALKQVMRGIADLETAPSHRLETGHRLIVRRPVFGLWRPYEVDVVECDHNRMILRAIDRHSGRPVLRHTLAVTPAGSGSRLTDRIELEGGLLTPLLTLLARRHYFARHAGRVRLLEERNEF